MPDPQTAQSSPTPITVAAVQMVATPLVEENLASAERLKRVPSWSVCLSISA